MTRDPRHVPADGAAVDKLELHARQQLSALVDGELSPDEARFLLRRLQHDTELSGSFERWQLCGDVLRGQVRRAVAPDFSERIAVAIAAAPVVDARQAIGSNGRRLAIGRWGGGAALAASVAAVAMLVGRQGTPEPVSAPVPAVAIQTLPSTEAVLVAVAPPPTAAAAATPTASAPSQVPRRPSAPVRVQREPVGPVVVAVAEARAAAEPTVAAAPVFVAQANPEAAATAALAPATTDPFASSAPLQARPWPRATLPGAASGYTASFESPAATRPFYPFEPDRVEGPVAPDGSSADPLPLPPDDDGTR